MKKSCMPEIVLVNTQIPENLGATARAMLNFNLKKLRVVSPLFELSNEKIIPLSAGADSVIKNIKKFSVFEDSVKDLNVLIATTNRLRSIKKKQIESEIQKEIENAEKEIQRFKINSTPKMISISEEIVSNVIKDIFGEDLNKSSIKATVTEINKGYKN